MCRSVNYHYDTFLCELSTEDRRSKPNHLRQTEDAVDYYDNNCLNRQFFLQFTKYFGSKKEKRKKKKKWWSNFFDSITKLFLYFCRLRKRIFLIAVLILKIFFWLLSRAGRLKINNNVPPIPWSLTDVLSNWRFLQLFFQIQSI